MFLAADLLPALPDDFEVVLVEQRPRTVTRDGVTHDIADSTLLARRVAVEAEAGRGAPQKPARHRPGHPGPGSTTPRARRPSAP